jgi:outer membrane receptor for ferrienterochelin and colicins
MKSLHFIYLLALSVFSLTAMAQSDSTTSFLVNGTCGQCKQRLEKGLQIKGIRNATWDIASKQLTVAYDPALISLRQIHRKAADLGHDTELEKSADDTYKSLPDCCLYREIHDEEEFESADTNTHIRGVVLENKNGMAHPLAGATILYLGTREGTKTNEHGEFVLPKSEGIQSLAISYSGLRTDTVSIKGMNDLEITLVPRQNLNSVVVTARRRPTFIDSNNPFRISVVTKKELLKAACCNLSESFETNPSVDVSYNDAVTGSRQIQLLGLAGPYTQLTVENLPGPRGIATPLGLNSIAGPWVESMQLIKGAGSVVNGFESIAGQINVELRKPRESEQLYLNGYINNMGKTDVNLNLAHRFNDKWSTGFLLHDDFLYNKIDFNDDMFRDLPTGNQFSGINRWQYLGDNGLMSQFGIKFMTDTKTGGALDYDPSIHKFSTHHYGLGIDSRRYEAFGKIGYVFPDKMYKSVGFEISTFKHTQDAYFGLREYNASQKNFYSNLIYQSELGSEAHTLKTGLSILHDNYDEEWNGNIFKRTESVPGAFAEYTYKFRTKLDIVAGMRVDRNNLFGWFGTPRVNIRYSPSNGTTIRFSAGRGQRTANIFAEHMGNLVSSRQVVIENNGYSGGAYGLNPEVAWNKGISFDQKFKLFNHEASLGVDFYRNDFKNQVIADLETPQQLKFYDLKGKSFSNSLQAELNITPADKFDVRLAYRYFDVKATYSGQLLDKPFTARHRGFANLAYDLSGWKLDYTVNLTGPKRIPFTGTNPAAYQLDERSPSFVTMNAQVSRSVGKKKALDLYIGGENLTNYFQDNAILAADQPFGDYFDASLIWAPVSGRLLYAGFRFKID